MSTSGGSGGGAALTPVTIVAAINVDGTIEQTLYLSDVQASLPGSNQFAIVATSTPTIVAALGRVVDTPGASVSNVDTSTIPFGVGVDITVSNLAATEVLQIGANVTVPVAGPNQNATIDFTDADTTPIAGTDLAWDGTSVVTSTAGGVFVVSLALQSGYE